MFCVLKGPGHLDRHRSRRLLVVLLCVREGVILPGRNAAVLLRGRDAAVLLRGREEVLREVVLLRGRNAAVILRGHE